VESGTVTIEEERVALGPLVAEAARLMAPLADGAGVELVDSASASLPDVRADPSCLKRVVLNLLANAVKFTPTGGRVRLVGGLRDDGSLGLSVIDTGPGIAKGDLAAIFEPFRRGESLIARKTEGVGLGLPLANGFMKLHGGGIDVVSPPDGGTTATLWLPPYRVLNDPPEVVEYRSA